MVCTRPLLEASSLTNEHGISSEVAGAYQVLRHLKIGTGHLGQFKQSQPDQIKQTVRYPTKSENEQLPGT